MKAKDLLKRLLPIGVALVLIALIAILITVLTKDKVNPSLEKNYADEAYLVYDNGKIKITNKEGYERLKSEYGTSVLVDVIDQELLKEEIAKVTKDEVAGKVEEAIFGETIAEYIEANEFEEDEAQKEIQKLVDEFIENGYAAYGIEIAEDEITVSKVEDKFVLTVKENTEFYNYMKLTVARYNYAFAKISEKWATEFEDYKKYKEDKAKYDAYVEALEKWESDKEGTKPEEVKAPEAVTLTIDETKFSTKWDEENVDAFWAVIIPFDSLSSAETALLQNGLVVKNVSVTQGEVTSTKAFWFHYGREVLGEGETSEFEKDDKDGYDIITKTDYYKQLAQANIDDNTVNTSANPDKFGAYVLSEDEIKQAIINLYNQYYGAKKIEATPDAATEIAKGEESDFYYTAAKITSLGLLSTVTGNKFNEFDPANTDFRKVFNESVTSSSYKIYWILGKEDKVQWDDATEADKNAYMAKADLVKELLEAATTTTYINQVMDELRVEKGLVFYDTVLESKYMSSFTTTSYKKTKKSSKTLVAKVGEFEISVADLFNALNKKYAAAVALEQYQYQWMFLEAADAEGNLFNKYVDYDKFLSGKPLKKCIADNKEAKELWKSISGEEGTIANIKNSFASGGYASYGYPASYGWNNFLRDFFSTYYGVSVNSIDELGIYLIYEEIVNDYNQYIANASNLNMEVFEADYIAKLNEYINCNGYHFLICVKDAEGKTVDPEEWTEEQKTAATEFYGKVLELAKALNKDKVQEFFSALNTAYSNISKYPVDFATGEYIKANIFNAEGVAKFKYEYTYNDGVTNYDAYKFDLAQYKSLGLSVTYEELATTAGVMVKEFEEGVREIWNKHINDMIENGGFYEETEIHSEMISTSFGYHLYVNLNCDLSTYFTNDKFAAMPSFENIALYLYEKNHASDTDYKSIVDLVAAYRESVQLGKQADLEAIANVVKNIDGLKDKTVDANFVETVLYGYTNVQELIDKATTETKKIDTDDIVNNTLVQAEITNWVSTVYEEYSGSYYYQLQVLNAALKNASKLDLCGKTGNIEGLLNKYIESYQNYLAYNKTDKDLCEKLLKAFEGDVLLSETLDAELTAKFKQKAVKLYNDLSAADKEDLKEAWEAAGLDK